MTNFSTTINGRDLRATIINKLVESNVEHLSGDDPATFTDDLMVQLGLASGYDESGDYTEGYRDYMVSVGLIAEHEQGLPVQWGQPPLRPGYRWPTEAERNEVP